MHTKTESRIVALLVTFAILASLAMAALVPGGGLRRVIILNVLQIRDTLNNSK